MICEYCYSAFFLFADSIPRQLGFAVTTYHPKSFENFKQIPKAQSECVPSPQIDFSCFCFMKRVFDNGKLTEVFLQSTDKPLPILGFIQSKYSWNGVSFASKQAKFLVLCRRLSELFEPKLIETMKSHSHLTGTL